MWIAPYTRDAAWPVFAQCTHMHWPQARKRWAQAECGLRSEKHDKIQNANCKGLALKHTLRTSNSSGFTLIEIIIVIVILGILSALAALIILQGAKSYTAEDFRSNTHYQAKLAAERMAREIRLIRSQTAADIPTMNATDLIFCDITGKAVEFQLAGTILNRRESATCSPLAWGGWNSLATGVAPLSFTYLQQDGVSAAAATNLWYVVIDVTDLQGTESLRIRTRVHPMNF